MAQITININSFLFEPFNEVKLKNLKVVEMKDDEVFHGALLHIPPTLQYVFRFFFISTFLLFTTESGFAWKENPFKTANLAT